ncbi:lysostaphin resistance A-like protein [Lysobacter korlensis]|uniref:Lysostaphin resistance A-like protein n=1 Tax=Lysobacter korlensis TaxID=553636 RepID=A0ABV6RZZ5_9GAMM
METATEVTSSTLAEVPAASLWEKVRGHAITRLVLGAAMPFAIQIAVMAALHGSMAIPAFAQWINASSRVSDVPLPIVVISGLAVALLAIPAYRLLVRWTERREATELGVAGAGRGLLFGVGIGAGLMVVVVGLLWALGSYRVIGSNPASVMLAPLMIAISSGVAEEILLRGVVFRIIEQSLGSVLALLASALLFGFGHMGNPGATVWSSLAIAVEAGLLLAALYMLTRSLWASIGAHFAWNLMLGGVFGIPVSGLQMDGWLRSTVSGPEWLTGGAFGVEASVPTLVLATTVAVALLMRAKRAGNFVPFRWRLGGARRQRLQAG